jgi:hypothetical protein
LLFPWFWFSSLFFLFALVLFFLIIFCQTLYSLGCWTHDIIIHYQWLSMMIVHDDYPFYYTLLSIIVQYYQLLSIIVNRVHCIF